ncbi:M23 family metallopeptidase [Zavarzinia compransoris]|nr:M23 family metallopeptidase [Zavarzinia compransoris]TDP47964.1 peptidase M23-like protein [Zavarzinia compransoris]
MSNDAKHRLLPSRRGWFVTREIAVRDPWGVRWLKITRGVQVSALALGLGALGWVGFASYAAFDRTEAVGAPDLAAPDLAAPDLAAVKSLEAEVAHLRQQRDQAEAARLSAEKEITQRSRERDLARAAVSRLQGEHRPLPGDGKALAEADRLNQELALSEADRVQIEIELQVAEDRIAGLERDATLLRDMVARAETRATDLRDQVASLEQVRDDLATRLAPLASIEMGRFETGLTTTGLDIDRILAGRRGEEAESADVGGPFIAVDGVVAPTIENARLLDLARTFDRLDGLKTVAGALPLDLPVRRVELRSEFGTRRDPINRRLAFHAGLDFGGAVGTAVFATAPGEVVKAGWAGAYGRQVRVRHAFGVESSYSHLSAISVKVGDRIEVGDVVGKLGSSGRSTGPHLHYEVRLDNKPQDPIRFIEAGRHVQPQQGRDREPEAGPETP